MKAVVIGKDPYLDKNILKINYESDELPKIQLFNSEDVIVGNPSSNVAVAFVYTWKTDYPPEEISSFFQRVSNYAALTGLWRTTNGARYAFANILANPNINKLVLLVFSQDDNGHLLADSLRNLWEHGYNKDGVIINSKAPNPKFEQVPLEALDRIKRQVDLIILKKIGDTKEAERIIKACIQEPENAVDIDNIEFYSALVKNSRLYDDGARFEKPYIIDLLTTAKNVKFESKNLLSTVGQSIQAANLEDGIEQVSSFVFKNGTPLIDERGIITIETRSFSITIIDPLEKIPEGFSKQYIERYIREFMEGVGEKLDDFAYTYHERIFKKWGNQAEKITEILKNHPNTRRAMISLWDPIVDIGTSSPPCLDFIWAVIRNNKLEFHVVYRSHHLATVTESGKLMSGEGAFVPNLFALATLQQHIAENLSISRGPLVLTDFSGHLYVSRVK
jgi:thymidylate synthase (methanogen type)